MCLAVPGQIVESAGHEAVVDLQGNRLKISTLLTPESLASTSRRADPGIIATSRWLANRGGFDFRRAEAALASSR